MPTEIIVRVVLSILGNFLSKEVVDKFKGQIKAWVDEEVAKLPDCAHDLEQALCCKLQELAKDSANDVDDKIVAIVAAALGCDLSLCPAPAPAPEA